MVFFNNPPYSNTSNYSTLAEVYNMRKALTESEQKNTEHMARILRELKKLRPRASHDVAQYDADAEKVGKRGKGRVQTPEAKGDVADSYASDIKSINEALSDIAKRLSSLADITASQQHAAACVMSDGSTEPPSPIRQQHAAACVKERRLSDMSDGSTELVCTPDCVRP
jgi:hypothetical protein